jgi:L-threonylcarbamoyladenylate synthase
MQTTIGKDIKYASMLLQQGEIVAIPTETVYGLAANALNEDAVLRIYEAKQRPRFNPLILHVDSFEKFDTYAQDIPDACYRLAERFSPGPLTFLLPKKNNVPDLVTAGSDHVALRVPAHPFALELLKSIDFPLAAPSANPSGYVSPVTARHVYDGLHGRIPYILDGGPCQVGLESTIIGFEDGKVVLHRYGAVTAEDMEARSGCPVVTKHSDDHPLTPGKLKSHYAPALPLFVGDIPELMKRFGDKRLAVISFRQRYVDPAPDYAFVLSPSGDLHEAARKLFHTMRDIDAIDADVILAELFPEQGLGLAINDRLHRAQSLFR